MITAVFISDLRLHPDEQAITERFYRFVRWAATHTRAVYILGDFFHVWPGDDALDAWSGAIADRLAWLGKQGVVVYFMAGNRDFLLGKRFAKRAGVSLLTEPCVIEIKSCLPCLHEDENVAHVLLTHGDRYCTLDKGHQWLRRFTRNKVFSTFFLCLPLSLRQKLVNTVRQASQANRGKSMSQMRIVPSVMLEHMRQVHTKIIVHGHIHQYGMTLHEDTYQQYVLSDWDDNPQILCYNEPLGFYFEPLMGEYDYA